MPKLSFQRDPRVYARGIARKPPNTKRALGIDLGTNCGIAFCDFVPGGLLSDVPTYLDQWDLSIGAFDSSALRHIRFKQFLYVLAPDLIGFEDVKFTGTNEVMERGGSVTAIIARAATSIEFLGGLKTTLSVWAEEQQIPCQGVGINQIKRFATTKGNANKVDMILACNQTFGTNFDTENYDNSGVDNIADAAFVLKMMVELYKDGFDAPIPTSLLDDKPKKSKKKPKATDETAPE